jgi:hypothetical protein
VDRDHRLPLIPLPKKKRKKAHAAVEADLRLQKERPLIAEDVVVVVLTVTTMTENTEVVAEEATMLELLETRKKEMMETSVSKMKTNGFTNSTRMVSARLMI